MHHKIIALAALSTCAFAQDTMGTFRNTGTTYATRGASGASSSNPAVLWTRFDKECYAGWTAGVTPGTRDINGLQFVIQDQNLATQETFAVVAYTEDALLPSYPDVVTPLGTSANYTLPLGTGGGAYRATANFTTPILAPAGADVFVGLQMNQPWTITGTPAAVTDGLSVWEIRAALATLAAGQSIDVAGAGLPFSPADEGRFSGYYVPTPAAGPAMPVVTMFKITPILPIAGGTATAVTNQTVHPESSATAPLSFAVETPGAGTASMLSGLYPDAADPSLGGGRADNLGNIYLKTGMVSGVCFYLVDFGTFGLELPMSSFLPGSTGVSCLNLGTLQTLAIGIVTNGVGFNVTNLNLATRQQLAGFSWLSQSVGFDLATNLAHAGPCTRQLL
jgi:hypothetical protein